MSSSDSSNTVLIEGAGPVSLCLALALGRRGHRVTVFEPLSDLLNQVRRAGTIHPATFEVLDDLAYTTGSRRAASRHPSCIIGTATPRTDRGVRSLRVAEDTRFLFTLQCDRLKVVEEAFGLAKKLDNVTIGLDCEMTSLRQDDDGVVVTFCNEAGEIGEIEGAYLVSCEGAHSKARRAMAIEFEGFAFPDATMTLSVEHDFTTQRPYSYRNYIVSPELWSNFQMDGPLGASCCRPIRKPSRRALVDDAVIHDRLQHFYPTSPSRRAMRRT